VLRTLYIKEKHHDIHTYSFVPLSRYSACFDQYRSWRTQIDTLFCRNINIYTFWEGKKTKSKLCSISCSYKSNNLHITLFQLGVYCIFSVYQFCLFLETSLSNLLLFENFIFKYINTQRYCWKDHIKMICRSLATNVICCFVLTGKILEFFKRHFESYASCDGIALCVTINH
jgi:hypothetical protein